MKFHFDSFEIGSVTESSTVNSGENIQIRFHSVTRKTEGNGMIIGEHNILKNNQHVVRNEDSPSKDE